MNDVKRKENLTKVSKILQMLLIITDVKEKP